MAGSGSQKEGVKQNWWLAERRGEEAKIAKSLDAFVARNLASLAFRNEPSDETDDSSDEQENADGDDDDNLNLVRTNGNSAVDASPAVVAFAFAEVSVGGGSRAAASIARRAGRGLGGRPNEGRRLRQ